MKVAILKDPAFQPVAEYTADDLMQLLEKHPEFSPVFIRHHELENLSRTHTDVLALPYSKGNFSHEALRAIIRFHEEGGSLFFLGDIPHKDSWYPYRNVYSFELHMTRANDPIRITGITEAGREIFAPLDDFREIEGLECVAIRTTGFPDDITQNLIRNDNGDAWERNCVVTIQRKDPRFLGGRVVHIGFNGGEPREVACGAYPLEWSYNPGLLNRKWKVLPSMILKLLKWLTPVEIEGAIRVPAVHLESESSPITIELRNISGIHLEEIEVLLENTSSHKTVFRDIVSLPAEGRLLRDIPLPPRKPGIHKWNLSVRKRSQILSFHEKSEFVLEERTSRHPGFGASTYHAFKTRRVSEEYKTFVRGLLDRGVQFIRANLPWEDIEPEPGRYDWAIPDQLISFAESENFSISFWLFPTAFGSGLAEAGVPRWTLKEPAIDKFGRPGNFPTIWSPFYRQHYFGMVCQLAMRYANEKALDLLIIDFGNSDFPYSYHYYVNPPDYFDYSPIERKEFVRYLTKELNFDLHKINALFQRTFLTFDEIPVPTPDSPQAWSVYLGFREWSVGQGMREIRRILLKYAPNKTPEDIPGHGLGSISDLETAWYDVKKRHFQEEKKFHPSKVYLHNAGRKWGGEAWQVGGTYKELDQALFGSLRFNAYYNTIPGPDLNVFGEEVARIGYIRRSIMGAQRRHPEIAVLGEGRWNTPNKLPHVALRIDETADYLCKKHRFDFSCYRLLALPSSDTTESGVPLLPEDEEYYWLLRESVEKGLNLLIFPHSCLPTNPPRTFLRQIFKIEDVQYDDYSLKTVRFPDSFGGGQATGNAFTVKSEGIVLWKDLSGRPVLVKRPFGKGNLLLAGYDDSSDSLDGNIHNESCLSLKHHSLVRMAQYLKIQPRDFTSEQLNIFKDVVRGSSGEFFLALSFLKTQPFFHTFKVRIDQPRADFVEDLATGERYALMEEGEQWFSFSVPIVSGKGLYLRLS
ncbi:MAG: hypothetical protein D6679_08065 [Candidatus Hydrogenedentota bacterium]|nr:MAG: hypothetical protein D6679_08065 [Candidatus Hydrogenedentota bacterium]